MVMNNRQRRAMFAKMKGRPKPDFFRIATPIGFKKVLGKPGQQRLAIDEFKSEKEAQRIAAKLRKAPFFIPIVVEKGRI